jgi:beta-glucosidase
MRLRLRRSGLAGAVCVIVAVFAFLVARARSETRQGASASSPAPADIEQRVNAILSRMTLEEKIDMIGGVDGFFIRGFAEMEIPRLKMADGPMGVRNFGPATAMPGGINLAASWDPALAYCVGEQIGRDARAKGVNFLLGPGVNIYRAPMNGRNFEYFGEDPYLASRIAVGYVEGVQSEGVSATVKHFMGNNSEYDRHNTDDIIDERTLREIYLPVFEAAVKEAHAGAIMDAYNLVNGDHMTQNSFLNSKVLKEEWGFRGVLMSDWFATYDGVAAANSGLDLEMPSGAFMNRASLLPAIHGGAISMGVIDDKVRRILRLAVELHWLDRDQLDASIPRYNLQGRKAALDASLEGMVLLKNEGNLLPLNKSAIKPIAVIGPDAYPAVPVGGGSAGVRPFSAVSFLEGIANELGAQVSTYYDRGIPDYSDLAQSTNFSTDASGGTPGLLAEYFPGEDLQGDPADRRTDLHINFGPAPRAELGVVAATLPAGTGAARWTGYYSVTNPGDYDLFVQATGEAGGYYRVYVDDKLILDNWKQARALVGFATVSLDTGSHKIVVERHGRPSFLGTRFRFGIVREGSWIDAAAEKLASSSDAVVLAVGFDPDSESEGSDRTFRLPPGQDELIQGIATTNKRVIVAVTSGGAVDMRRWIDQVPALLETWYPGQEGGTALARILFGDTNPSGRLPVTFERAWEDNPVHDTYYPAPGTNEITYREGVFVGYRGYERNGTKTLFPFGYGLSYTSFRYQDLSVRPANNGVPAAGSIDSHPLYEVTFDVTNTGNREGAEVAEVYVGEGHPAVPRPAKELKAFARVDLRPHETRKVTIDLGSRSFAHYDTSAHRWKVDRGDFDIFVGRSIDDIQLKQNVSLSESRAAIATSSANK